MAGQHSPGPPPAQQPSLPPARRNLAGFTDGNAGAVLDVPDDPAALCSERRAAIAFVSPRPLADTRRSRSWDKIERQGHEQESPVSIASRIQIVVADITTLDVDIIVNAAKESLLGGGGVDGAIHRAAGPGLLEECRGVGRCPTGSVRITGGHRLQARHVIHAVGPVFEGGGSREAELLASCYRESLRLAAESGLATIAFPCISTGVFGYPVEDACDVAVATVVEWLAMNPLPESVTFCCFSQQDAAIYRRRLTV
jgi:O-acetyl-ADP-ribose deacetylase (regulator of RNase III)